MNGTMRPAPMRRAAAAGLLGAILAVSRSDARAAEMVEGYFEDVRPMAELNSPAVDWRPVISHDGRTIIFGSERSDGLGGFDLYMAQREEPRRPFTQVRNLREINFPQNEYAGSISADGLELFFSSNRPGGAGGHDLYVARRDDAGCESEFRQIEALTQLNDDGGQSRPSVSRDGRELYFEQPPNRGIWVARRPAPGEAFSRPQEFVWNSPHGEAGASLSSNQLTLFVGDWGPRGDLNHQRVGAVGARDIWMVRRENLEEPFSTDSAHLVNLGDPVNTALCETIPSIASDWPADRSKLYFARSSTCDRPEVNIYEATWRVLPDPDPTFRRADCNGDGQVTGQVSDAVFLLQFNFSAGAEPPCLAACDANGDGQVVEQVTDAVYLLQFNFSGGSAPPAPFPECGEFPTLASDDELGCENPTPGLPVGLHSRDSAGLGMALRPASLRLRLRLRPRPRFRRRPRLRPRFRPTAKGPPTYGRAGARPSIRPVRHRRDRGTCAPGSNVNPTGTPRPRSRPRPPTRPRPRSAWEAVTLSVRGGVRGGEGGRRSCASVPRACLSYATEAAGADSAGTGSASAYATDTATARPRPR